MAAAVGGASGSGRRKNMDAEINLVSFIDLLSMCICFLLMTAVWLEVGALQVKQSHGTEGAATEQGQEISLKVVSATQAEISLKKGGRAVQKASLKAASLSELTQQLDSTVARWVANSGGVQAAPIQAAMIETTPSVSYGDLVRVMDSLRKNQVVNLGVVPASRDEAMGGVR
jgi:biopolymer transport protein TolR